MTRSIAPEIKVELLERCVQHCIEVGFTDLTLRSLAQEIGTSHRMLLYHFQTREKLLKAILESFRRQQIASVAEDLQKVHTPEDLERIIRQIWTRLASSELRSFTTAFFEIYIECVRKTEALESVAFLSAALGDWLEPLSETLKRLGLNSHESRVTSRMILGSVRGLLLDLLASNHPKDRKTVEKAFDLLLVSVRPLLNP